MMPGSRYRKLRVGVDGILKFHSLTMARKCERDEPAPKNSAPYPRQARGSIDRAR